MVREGVSARESIEQVYNFRSPRRKFSVSCPALSVSSLDPSISEPVVKQYFLPILFLSLSLVSKRRTFDTYI